jgi:ATP-dependent DNA ligase
VVGWTDPEGSRPWLGALLLAYYDPDGRLIYAGRAGTGIDHAELEGIYILAIIRGRDYISVKELAR